MIVFLTLSYVARLAILLKLKAIKLTLAWKLSPLFFMLVCIIALAIPISIVATFNLMYFNNLTLNIMTLGGLALGIGMLVDNSVVVIENIARHWGIDTGRDRRQSAIVRSGLEM